LRDELITYTDQKTYKSVGEAEFKIKQRLDKQAQLIVQVQGTFTELVDLRN